MNDTLLIINVDVHITDGFSREDKFVNYPHYLPFLRKFKVNKDFSVFIYNQQFLNKQKYSKICPKNKIIPAIFYNKQF